MLLDEDKLWLTTLLELDNDWLIRELLDDKL